MAISLNQLLLITFFYLLLEWLFFATKPSFLSLLPFGEQVQVLFVTYLPLLLFGLAFQVPILAVDFALRRQVPQLRRLPLPAIVPAAFATALGLMQFDTFTSTIIGFGIVRTGGFQPYLYLAGAAALMLFLIYYLSREQAQGLARRHLRLRVAIAAALVSASIVLTLVRASTPIRREPMAGDFDASGLGSRQLPNIVLLAADGVNADHLTAYGYDRETTPYLDAYLDDALIVDNAVSNSTVTSASLTAMLTGKLPTTTKLIYGPPHVLTAADAYQHLPGILKSLGYTSLQETVREWGDSADLNMRQAFDVANGRTVESPALQSLPAGVAERFVWEKLFYDKLLGRLRPRLLHILGLRRMEDIFGMVKPLDHGVVWGTDDATRVARVLAFMKESAGPFFVHLHLLGSHCCPHKPERRVFSAGDGGAASGRDDFEISRNLYDDTILSADRHLGKVLAWLEESGEIENTVIVYSSDHTAWWNVNERVPLIFRFPQGEHRGRLQKTAQLLDVAPTLLDELGLEIPRWMEGDSLLRPEELRDLRPIFTTTPRIPDRKDENWRSDTDWGPPFYGLETIGLVICQRWYRIDLRTGERSRSIIPNHTARCPRRTFPTEPEVTALLVRHLEERGIG